MISVYICEDDPKQLQQIRQIITKVIVDQQLDMSICLACQDPHELLDKVNAQQPQKAIYVLDIALNSDINGIQLASQIRDMGRRSKIIFITTHTELSLMVFQYQVEALDFILKDFPDSLYERFSKVLHVAQDRFQTDENDQDDYVQIKIGETVRSINVKSIIFFESSTSPHKIVVHLDDGELEYYGLLKDVPDLSPNFYRCHKSYVVNLKRIKSLDKHLRRLTMANGEKVLCSAQANRYLAKWLAKSHNSSKEVACQISRRLFMCYVMKIQRYSIRNCSGICQHYVYWVRSFLNRLKVYLKRLSLDYSS